MAESVIVLLVEDGPFSYCSPCKLPSHYKEWGSQLYEALAWSVPV